MKRADRVWRDIVALVMNTRGDWRRAVIEATGMPFSRVRALARLERQSLSLRELAHAMACDAPAATVAVNDLEQRGLVERRPHPDDRRAKLAVITPAGRRMMAVVAKVHDAAPPQLVDIGAGDLAVLERLFSGR